MAQACEGHVLPSMDLASKRVSKLLITWHHHFQRLTWKETSYETRRMSKYVIFHVNESFVWLTSVWKWRKTKVFFQYHSVRSRTDDLLGAVNSESFYVTKPLFSQTNCRKTSPYKLSHNNVLAWIESTVLWV